MEQIINLIKNGKPLKVIARKCGIDEDKIIKIAKDNNLTLNTKKTKITEDVISEINVLIDKGFTNKQIADELCLSPTTVRKYTKEFLNKDTNSLRTKTLANKTIELTQEQKEVLFGSLLGDMNININWKNARPTIAHGGDQEAYFDYKCEIFKGLLGKINKTPRFDKRTNKLYNAYKVKFLTNPYFTELYNKFYPNGIKTVSQEWLDLLTPRSLAFWFMDDGTNSGVIATNSFSQDECELIRNHFLNKWNIQTTLQHQKNKGGVQYLIYIKICSRKDFYNLVKPYIIPSMLYKFINWIP